jgi:hypothetical protein
LLLEKVGFHQPFVTHASLGSIVRGLLDELEIFSEIFQIDDRGMNCGHGNYFLQDKEVPIISGKEGLPIFAGFQNTGDVIGVHGEFTAPVNVESFT